MTQRQIPHQVTLPTCCHGHAARHILDQRAAIAGGGHFIECPCRSTARCGDVGTALDDWFRVNNKRRQRTPRPAPVAPLEPPPAASILQFPLPLQGGRRA